MNEQADPSSWLYITEAKSIQSYILGSDRLKEMVGASELVEALPLDLLETALKDLGAKKNDHYTILTQAAGGARILFRQKPLLEDFFRIWPVLVESFAPGLAVVQAAAPVNGSLTTAMKSAEKSCRASRNRVYPDLPVPGPLAKRNQRSGRAAAATLDVGKGGVEALDREALAKYQQPRAAQHRLLDKIVGEARRKQLQDGDWPLDFDEIADEKNYLGIVHADANGLGDILIKLGEYLLSEPDKAADIYHGFSVALSEATEWAVQQALEPILSNTDQRNERRKEEGKKELKYPVRPIVCAGDDVTMVLSADEALPFTERFLQAFEETSAAKLGTLNVPDLPQLTACAGIAFVKKSFPFAQAYDLAESLCGYGKKRTGRQCSALAFWRVTTSGAGDYETILHDELTTAEKHQLSMMPYTVGSKRAAGLPTFTALLNAVRAAKDLPRGGLREMLSAAYESRGRADRVFERLRDVAGERGKTFETALRTVTMPETSPLWQKTTGTTCRTPLHDLVEVLQIGLGSSKEVNT